MAVVEFVPADFLEVYPHFVGPDGKPLLSDAALRHAFEVACLLLDNTNSSPVPYDPEQGVETRKVLLWLLVCHLSTLALWPAGQSGPLSSASEGSVSTSFAVPDTPNGKWYGQTTCGATFWTAIKKYTVGGRYYPCHYVHPWG